MKPNPIKVGFYVFFPGGGIGRYTAELLKHFPNKGNIEPYLFCSPNFQWKEIGNVKIVDKMMQLSHPFPPFRKARFLLAQWKNPFTLVKEAVKKDIDIVHFSSINYLFFPFWKNAFQKAGLKMAISVHDVKRQKAIIWRNWEDKQLKEVYRFADILFVHSEYQAKELIDFAEVHSNKIKVVPHGPYPYSTGVFPERKTQKTALFFGQIRDEKRLDLFIKSLVHLPNTYGLIAGSIVPRHKGASFYQNLIKELNLESRVTFVPAFIPEEDVYQYFAQADYAVFPYDASFTSQSGVLSIAAYFKKPVIVSDAPVLKETIEKSNIGLVADPSSSKSFANGMLKMEKLLGSHHTFDFESFEESFGWQTNVDSTIKAYQQLIQVPATKKLVS